MAVLLDTRSVAPEDRREAWSEMHARALFPLAIDFTGNRGFIGRSEVHQLGELSLFRIRGDACVVRRTPQKIHAGDPDQLVLALLLSGCCAVEQDGRQAILRRGDLTTWRSSRPFRIPHGGLFDLMLLSIPTPALGLGRVHHTADLVSGARGSGAIAMQLLRESWRQLEDASLEPTDADLQDALLAVARAVCARSGAPGVRDPAPPGALAARVRAYAERHLDDPDLTPARIAREHSVSLRHLHRAFHDEEETLQAWIRRRRLERCREDLLNPELDHLPVGVLAARWGIGNHSHFSRAFRAAYGVSPRELRDRHCP